MVYNKVSSAKLTKTTTTTKEVSYWTFSYAHNWLRIMKHLRFNPMLRRKQMGTNRANVAPINFKSTV